MSVFPHTYFMAELPRALLLPNIVLSCHSLIPPQLPFAVSNPYNEPNVMSNGKRRVCVHERYYDITLVLCYLCDGASGKGIN